MKYPFVKCLNPRLVINPYNHEKLIIGCGSCPACLVAKSNQRALLTSIEESHHRFCLFVTLTYSNDYLPMFKLVRSSDGKYFKYVNVTSRIHFDDNLICNEDFLNYDDETIFKVAKRCKLNGNFSYLYKPDIQKFLKRLRKTLKKYGSDETLRYLAVGEFGSRTLRAHFHLLLFFDERKTLEILQSHLSKVWSYGRIDSSLSRGDASSYCASYVNSYVSLPQIFRAKAIRPFQTRSTHFASEVRQEIFQKIYEDGYSAVTGLCEQYFDKVVPIPLSCSLKATFFPKCREYANKSFEQLYRTYTAFSTAKSYFNTSIVTELVESICDCSQLPLRLAHYYSYTPEQILAELYMSKYFETVCCGFTRSKHLYLKRIVEFYDFIAYENLKSNLESQELYGTEYSDHDYRNFYINYFDTDAILSLFDKPIYKDFFTESNIKVLKKIKHRVINDYFNIFNS